MGLDFGDLDNDGWLDFYAGTGAPDLGLLVPNRMFRNDGGARVPGRHHRRELRPPPEGHAVSFGDIDNDGDQDVFEEMGGAYLADKAHSALYENPATPIPGSGSSWKESAPTVAGHRRPRPGDRGTPAGRRPLYRTVGQRRQLRRLAAAAGDRPRRRARDRSIEVFWPVTGQKQRLVGVKPKHRYRVREGSPKARGSSGRPSRVRR
jgi:hypothetical protein